MIYRIQIFTMKFAGLYTKVSVGCAVIYIALSEFAGYTQEIQNAKCSFWISGNPLGTMECRTSWNNGRIYSINYLAGEIQGRGNPETVFAWNNGWIPGRYPECLVYKPTGYGICQK